MAFFIIFTACLISGMVVVVNGELFLIALVATSSVRQATAFGHTIDLTAYSGSAPWALALTGAVGSALGSGMYYLAGIGSRRLSPKIQGKLKKFDFERFKKLSVPIIFTGAAVSIPPISLVSVAAGMIKCPAFLYLGVSYSGKLLRFLAFAYLTDIAMRWFLR